MKKRIFGLMLTLAVAFSLCVGGVGLAFANGGTEGKDLYKEDFASFSEGDLFGDNGFTVTADKKAKVNGTGRYATLPIQAFSEDWEFTAELTFPEGGGYSRLIVFGMTGAADSRVEFNFQKYASTSEGGNQIDSFIVDKGVFIGASAKNSLSPGAAVLKVNKVGNKMTISVNDTSVTTYEAQGQVGAFNGMELFSDVTDMLIDNLVVREIIADTTVSSVALSADKTEISSVQSALLTASVAPQDVKVTSYVWKVNGTQVSGKTGKTYLFRSSTAGAYSTTCTANGVESNAVTVNVTEASEDVKDAVYYENFDAMSENSLWGNFDQQFKVSGGVASTTGKMYSRSDLNFDYIQNWDFSMDIIFNEAVNNASFLGFVARDIHGLHGEVEFNLKKAPVADGESADKDAIVIKVGGVETFFNDSEVYGKMPELNIEIGQKQTLRVVRYEDQLEVYLNGVIAIKTFLADPTLTSGMFVYNFNDGGKSVSVDNILVKPAAEIIDKVLPPVVEVTSAYISASAIEVNTGETTTLTANCMPFDATPTTYQWYVGGVAIDGATEKSYAFKSDKAGDYVFTCMVDGNILSEAKTVKVTATAGEEPPAEKGCGSGITGDFGGKATLFAGIAVAGLGVVMIVITKRKTKTDKNS